MLDTVINNFCSIVYKMISVRKEIALFPCTNLKLWFWLGAFALATKLLPFVSNKRGMHCDQYILRYVPKQWRSPVINVTGNKRSTPLKRLCCGMCVCSCKGQLVNPKWASRIPLYRIHLASAVLQLVWRLWRALRNSDARPQAIAMLIPVETCSGGYLAQKSLSFAGGRFHTHHESKSLHLGFFHFKECKFNELLSTDGCTN